jgi:hypothetical protein
VICWPRNLESAPEPHALHPIQPAFDHKLISESSGAAVINLRSYDYWIPMVLGHFGEREAEGLGETGTRDFDETQISDVRDDTSTIGVEEHHLHLRANTRWNGHGTISDLGDFAVHARECEI